MSDLWFVLVVVVVVVLALFYLRTRRKASGSPPVGSGRADGDYVRGREDSRVTGMSAEDRDWEAASLQRDVDRRGPSGPG
jgi:hypothetical protein